MFLLEAITIQKAKDNALDCERKAREAEKFNKQSKFLWLAAARWWRVAGYEAKARRCERLGNHG